MQKGPDDRAVTRAGEAEPVSMNDAKRVNYRLSASVWIS